ncbi:hypothetical protein GGI12_001108 [Dipsacomyces acuminosporus]|nr:hypothetical protein GGI12_001108 [Dipsacomyces acuminosporus]
MADPSKDTKKGRGEMFTGFDPESHISDTDDRAKSYKSEFQAQVPEELYNLEGFIPTSMLGNAMASPDVSKIPPSSFPTARNKSSSPSDEMTWETHNMSFPHSSAGIRRSSWFNRTVRGITGDLGPIEHQDMHNQNLCSRDIMQMSGTDSANRMKGSAFDSSTPVRDALAETKGWVRTDFGQGLTEAGDDETRGWL